MIKLPEKALNIGDIGTYLRPRYKASQELPANKAALFREPIKYKAGIEPLDNNYLEDLIQKNVVIHEGSKHDMLKSQYDAADTRVLYNSLSDNHKTKFIELVKALELDKENLDMLKGMIIAGGEIRVVASTGDVMFIHVLTKLLGIKLREFYGVSAGGFQAAGQAVGAPNSSVFSNTVDTDFTSITKDIKKLETWVNKLIKEGYTFTTGKEIDIVLGKHIEELGSNLQVLVGEMLRRGGIPLFKNEYYYLPEELESRFNINPYDFETATLIAASANLPGLLFSYFDWTFGNCFIKDSSGKKHYILDGGFIKKNQIPYHPLEKSIKQYLEGKREKPPFYFIVGNKRVESKEIPPEVLKEIKENGTFIEKFFVRIGDFLDSFSTDPVDIIHRLGAQIAYTEAICAVPDPFYPSELAILNSGNLRVSTPKREVLICANIPRAIDDLHNNLVDKEYINSNGKVGKSPMQLYTDEIDKASQRIDLSSAIFTARKESSQII